MRSWLPLRGRAKLPSSVHHAAPALPLGQQPGGETVTVTAAARTQEEGYGREENRLNREGASRIIGGEVRCGEKARVSDDLHFDQAALSRPVGWGWPHCSLVTTHGPWRGLACRTIEFRAELTKRTRRCGAQISCRQIRKPVFDLSEEHRDLRLS